MLLTTCKSQTDSQYEHNATWALRDIIETPIRNGILANKIQKEYEEYTEELKRWKAEGKKKNVSRTQSELDRLTLY